MSAESELQLIASALRESGLQVEAPEEPELGLVVQHEDSYVALALQNDEEGGYLVHLQLDLELYVPSLAAPEVLMGLNFMNQDLHYGHLVLELLESGELDAEEWEQVQAQLEEPLDESALTVFGVMGQTVLWLPHLGAAELDRLTEHLARFEREMMQTIDENLAVTTQKGMSA